MSKMKFDENDLVLFGMNNDSYIATYAKVLEEKNKGQQIDFIDHVTEEEKLRWLEFNEESGERMMYNGKYTVSTNPKGYKIMSDEESFVGNDPYPYDEYMDDTYGTTIFNYGVININYGKPNKNEKSDDKE